MNSSLHEVIRYYFNNAVHRALDFLEEVTRIVVNMEVIVHEYSIAYFSKLATFLQIWLYAKVNQSLKAIWRVPD